MMSSVPFDDYDDDDEYANQEISLHDDDDGNNRSRAMKWRQQLRLSSSSTIISQQRQRYYNLMEQYRPLLQQQQATGDAGDDNAEESTKNEATSAPLGEEVDDPLTVYLQEQEDDRQRQQNLDLEYRKERALRKRNKSTTTKVIEEEPDDAAAYLQLIQKDLQRLQSPKPAASSQQQKQRRMECLKRVLFVFSMEHSNESGYLQGMHEIVNYVLYGLEKQQDPQAAQADNGTATIEADTTNTTTNTMEADCFVLTECILTSLYAAYDVVVVADDNNTMNTNTNTKKPLEAMSRRIVAQLQPVWPELYHALVKSFANIPSQLIFTKWIRLLFSREIITTTGTADVEDTADRRTTSTTTTADVILMAWDGIFQCAHDINKTSSSNNSNNTAQGRQQRRRQQQQTNNVSSLQLAVESMAAARLWQHGHTILQLQNDESTLLHWFMNIPPESIQSSQDQSLNVWISRMRILALGEDGAGNISSDSLPPPPPPSSVVVAPSRQQQQQKPNAANPSASLSPFRASLPQKLQKPSFQIPVNWEASAPLRLTSLTNKLAETTQSLGKRITEEWGTIQQEWEQQQQQQQHAAAAAAAAAAAPPPASSSTNNTFYNLDYYSDRFASSAPVAATTTTTTNDGAFLANNPNTIDNNLSPPQTARMPPVPDHPTPTIPAATTTTPAAAVQGGPAGELPSHRIHRNVGVLQQFAFELQNQGHYPVPPQIWQALTDLQQLGSELR